MALLKKYVMGNRRVHTGTWSVGATETTDEDTELWRVETCLICHKGTSVEEASAVVNNTFPLAKGTVTIVGTSGDTGYWIAIGF